MSHPTQPRCSTGISGLDDVLNGGLIANRLYLAEGPPGSGKTTLAIQFLLAGHRAGERVLYVTLSETAEELRDTAAAYGWSLEGVEILELLANESAVSDELTMFHSSEVELSETISQLQRAVDSLKPSRVVIDSLSELRLLAQSSLRFRRQVLALKTFFNSRRCTSLFLDGRTTANADTQLQSLAQGVLQLDQSAPSYGRIIRQLRVIKFRGSDFRSGFHHALIAAGGLQVFPRLIAAEHGQAFDKCAVTSGVPELDALLGGGVDPGSSTLLVGPAGTGKSTLALQFARSAVARGEHAQVFTFDESSESMLNRLHSLGLGVEPGNDRREMGFQQIDPAEITPGQFAHMVRSAVERDAARVIVIDSLNGYMNAMVDGQYLTAQLHELLSYLRNHGVCTFIVAAQSRMLARESHAPGDASYLADTVILTRFFEHTGQVRKAISVLKKRSGLHEDTIRELRFSERGLHLSGPLQHLSGVLTGVPVELGLRTGTGDGAEPV